MKSLIFLLIFQLFCSGIWAQVKLSGIITDEKKIPLRGANLSLQQSYDGASTDSLGRFVFRTTLQGTQYLTATFIGYKPYLLKLTSTAFHLSS